MVIRYSAQSVSKGGTWKGVLLLLALTVLSVLTIDIFGRKISFMFLPLMAVFLWPRLESPIASIVYILLFGLLLDMLSAGPLGLWPLIFLSVFALFGPHKRLNPQSFFSALYLWLAALTFALIAAYFLGWFAIGRQPDIGPLLYQGIAAIILFPVVFGIRHVGRSLFSDSDGGGL